MRDLRTAARAWTRFLLVEGVPGLGKSTLLDRLVRRHVAEAPPRRLRTLVHLTQAHTYGPVAPDEDAGTLSRDAMLAHLAHVVTGLEWLATSLRAESRPKCYILVDCLHLTACLRPGVVAWPDVAALDDRLAAIGGRLALLDARDETIAERAVHTRLGTSFIEGYARRRFGATDGALIDHFRRERDRFRELFDASAMTKRRFPAEATAEVLTEEALDFWQT